MKRMAFFALILCVGGVNVFCMDNAAAINMRKIQEQQLKAKLVQQLSSIAQDGKAERKQLKETNSESSEQVSPQQMKIHENNLLEQIHLVDQLYEMLKESVRLKRDRESRGEYYDKSDDSGNTF